MQKNVDKWITFVDNLLITALFEVDKLWTSAETRLFTGYTRECEFMHLYKRLNATPRPRAFSIAVLC